MVFSVLFLGLWNWVCNIIHSESTLCPVVKTTADIHELMRHWRHTISHHLIVPLTYLEEARLGVAMHLIPWTIFLSN